MSPSKKKAFDRIRVKRLLKKYGKTMADLHRATEIPYNTMNHYLNGYRNPSIEPAIKIETALNDFEGVFLIKELNKKIFKTEKPTEIKEVCACGETSLTVMLVIDGVWRCVDCIQRELNDLRNKLKAAIKKDDQIKPEDLNK